MGLLQKLGQCWNDIVADEIANVAGSLKTEADALKMVAVSFETKAIDLEMVADRL